MIRNPLQNVEEVETLGIVVLGVILLATLEPVSAIQLIFAALLAAAVAICMGVDFWHWRHDHF